MSNLGKWRASLAAAAVLASFGLGACTTVEGTNALVDPATFEREVGRKTLSGIGIIPQEEKPMLKSPRAPLALPKNDNYLPQPTEEETGLIPKDSDKVQIDASNLTEEDLRRLRNARVVDLRSISGRPLTDTEAKQLTARMTAARLKAKESDRPLFLPPDDYFTTVNGQDLICLAPNGDLVTLDDPSCPAEIRQALQASN